MIPNILGGIIHFNHQPWFPSSSQVQDVVALRGRFEAQVCIRLPLHAHGTMLHPREEGEGALDAIGGHLPRAGNLDLETLQAWDP